jgi:hypothetical protein
MRKYRNGKQSREPRQLSKYSPEYIQYRGNRGGYSVKVGLCDITGDGDADTISVAWRNPANGKVENCTVSIPQAQAPAYGPSNLTASEAVPASGPSNLTASESVPASGPSNLIASEAVPASGPSNLTASEQLVAPTSGPSNLTASESVPTTGPTNLSLELPQSFDLSGSAVTAIPSHTYFGITLSGSGYVDTFNENSSNWYGNPWYSSSYGSVVFIAGKWRLYNMYQDKTTVGGELLVLSDSYNLLNTNSNITITP